MLHLRRRTGTGRPKIPILHSTAHISVRDTPNNPTICLALHASHIGNMMLSDKVCTDGVFHLLPGRKISHW
jgi:hypothetical protein